MFSTIRRIIDREGRLPIAAADLTPNDDLFAFGLTPYCAVRIMLALERELGVQFPRHAMKRETMRSLETISQTLRLAQSGAPLSGA
ncbi:phosphopantetheine-binding protein [Methylocystis sp. MJC1]|jgi:acyl carrier protein|uniref:phosphopantetheine-binding protein n=1 Tax=Methylocystis sp. MJC1 TaxID=2654282 RepID=UPI0013EB3C83|nr:phosphopantetheine-binding protein [Methylocystis sp. MJC1]KAF2989070.1 Aminoacyl carrier protein [Methylocystis sp. MJC1]MBU6527871.1 acyl carrier protein [Methylocystis sp. MJC1]UZX10792.1 phosphopantetheine-binding protein [Methylocystis sp. MJC1]